MNEVRIPARIRGPARDLNRTRNAQDGTMSVGRATDQGGVHLFFLGVNGETIRLTLDAAQSALLATLIQGAIVARP